MVVLALIAVRHDEGLRFVLRAMSQHRQPARGHGGADAGVVRAARRAGAGGAVDGEGRQKRSGPVRRAGRPPALCQCRAALPRRATLPRLRVCGGPRLDGSYRIELRRAALDPAAPDLAAVEAGEPRTVLRVGQELHFSYFGKLREATGPAGTSWPTGPEAAAGDPAGRRRGSRLAGTGGSRCGSQPHGIAVRPKRPSTAGCTAAGTGASLKPSGATATSRKPDEQCAADRAEQVRPDRSAAREQSEVGDDHAR